MKAFLMAAIMAAAIFSAYAIYDAAERAIAPPPPPEMARVERYFPTPAASAAILDKLVGASDWGRIATYADWSAVAPETLALLMDEFARGVFTRASDALAPFDPGVAYMFHRRESAGDAERIAVYVAPRSQGDAPSRLMKYYLELEPGGYRLVIDPALAAAGDTD